MHKQNNNKITYAEQFKRKGESNWLLEKALTIKE
jgi:hypothetical protein